ncbi:MAG: 3-phosphoshikimate 1-carboxyvinyltransferase [Ruminococcus sp.]|nr:3-phosphoshikimate 1-carboxyvinyltransferase [Ruminococcus sp.]
MDIKISPTKLSGTVAIPSSKSFAHREIICASLSKGTSVVGGVSFSKDIYATLSAMESLGARYTIQDDTITIKGISTPNVQATIDCYESGSTLRFIIPIVGALGVSATLKGQGRLPERPITPFIRELPKKGISFDYNNTMPFSMNGKLKNGTFELEGDISSQFITGLLFALPLLDGNSKIVMTSPLQSKPYVDMTIQSMANFGVYIVETDYGYYVEGNQEYKPLNHKVEGDYSQAGFFYVANAIGNDIVLQNLLESSIQGDKKIVEVCEKSCYNRIDNRLNAYTINATNIPDLVPILAVLGCFGDGTSKIIGAERLKIKESDRLVATADALNRIGGKVTPTNDGLIIEPIEHFIGGTVDGFGDHRIVMATAIASTRCMNDVIILGANAVEKSYPNFFRDFKNLGGKIDVINV